MVYLIIIFIIKFLPCLPFLVLKTMLQWLSWGRRFSYSFFISLA